MQISQDVRDGYELAKKTQLKAHAPYSNFQVGAALKLKTGQLIAGCNVENASYGATVCAERVALSNMVATYGKSDIEFIIVVTNTRPAIGPCALCLQVISEFCLPQTPIYFANPTQIESVKLFEQLLPAPFSKIPDQV